MNQRIIIENRTTLSDVEAVERALVVMRRGKISGSNGKRQYCYGTTFPDDIVVWTDKNRGGSDRLVVTTL